MSDGDLGANAPTSAETEVAWMERRSGRVPIVLYAPHGGRRNRPVRRGDSVNDLYTAELALELAERLDAHALVNHGLDRNRADLNRISALSKRQPIVLDALSELIEHASEGGHPPLLLLVHGWNVSAACCDLGVGITDSGGVLRGRHPTVSRQAFDRTVRGLARALDERGLQASIGQRFPASARDNATQLFSGRHADHDDERVAAVARRAAAGHVDAIQLELGIPLRWPGPLRDRLVEALVEVASSEIEHRGTSTSTSDAPMLASRREWSLPPRESASKPPRGASGIAVQAILDDGSGLFLGAEPTGADSMAARLCVAAPDGSLVLFVGEGPWLGDSDCFETAGFSLVRRSPSSADDGPSITVRYRGPVVRYPTHDAFLDLEDGLANAEIAHAEVELALAGEQSRFGTLSGKIEAGELSFRGETTAVWERGGRRTQVRPRTKLRLTQGALAPLEIDQTEETAGRVSFAEDATGRRWVRVTPGEPDSVELVGEVAIRVPVYRPLPTGDVVRVTFGVATFMSEGGRTTRGLFERVELLRAAERR